MLRERRFGRFPGSQRLAGDGVPAQQPVSQTVRRIGRAAGALVLAAAMIPGVLVALPATGQAAPQAPAPTTGSAAATGPIGWDSYRHPERLTELGSGARLRQTSSFDRAGGNDDGFDGTYSCLRTTSAGCVLAEQTGAGEIDSIWFTRDEGNVTKTGTITVELDGKTVLSGSLQEIVNGAKGAPFVYPLVANANQSSGGVYLKVPMPYRSSMRVTTQHNPLFYHVSYRNFPSAAGVKTFDPSDKANDVVAVLRKAGTADPKKPVPGAVTKTGAVDVPAGATRTIASATGPGAISQLALTLPQLVSDAKNADAVLRKTRLRISFDGKRRVDAPLGEFFGTGLGLYDVRSLMFGVDAKSAKLSSWWSMPYVGRADIQLTNGSSVPIRGGKSQLTSARNTSIGKALATGKAGYFTANGVSANATQGRDHSFLSTTGQGRVVGVTHTVEGRIAGGNVREYLEGDERLFTDGALSPEVHGTGTEDFYESGWYFNKGTFNAPMNGNPVHEDRKAGCQYDCTGMYRLLLADSAEYDSSVRFSIEHGAANTAAAVESSTTYSYQRGISGAGQRVWSDRLTIGDAASEKAHAYTPNAGAPTKVSSAFEGHDGQPGGISAPVTMNTRPTSAPVSFTMAVDRRNRGVVLRRISDQNAGYQSAAVSVDGKSAGTWTQPLGNKIRRWLDDSFELPTELTKGKSKVTVRLTPAAGAPKWTVASYASVSIVDNYRDQKAPEAVTGPAAAGDERNTMRVSWQPARDDVYAPTYRIYGSTKRGFSPGPSTMLGTTTEPGFIHGDLGLNETWYYRVRAVDAAGREGPASPEASGKTGKVRRYELEQLLPPVSADAPADAQGDCCGARWSNGAQLFFQPKAAGKKVTLKLPVKTAGKYDLSGALTKAPDYGITTFALDGKQLGAATDGYNAGGVVVAPVKFGQHQLSAGDHTLTITVTGKNAASKGFFAGLDFLDARWVG